MKTRMNKDGKYYGKVICGRTPDGKPIYRRIVADSPVELWKQHYLLKYAAKEMAAGPDDDQILEIN